MKLAKILSVLTGVVLACQSSIALGSAVNSAADAGTAAKVRHATPPNNSLWIQESSKVCRTAAPTAKRLHSRCPPEPSSAR